MWLTAPKGATPANQAPATDWQIAARRDIYAPPGLVMSFVNQIRYFSIK